MNIESERPRSEWFSIGLLFSLRMTVAPAPCSAAAGGSVKMRPLGDLISNRD